MRWRVLDAGLAAQPDQPELLYESALVAERLGRIDIFESRLKRLLQLKPDHAHAFNALGYSLAERNLRLDEAQQLIDQALALAPDDPFILDSKGWVALPPRRPGWRSRRPAARPRYPPRSRDRGPPRRSAVDARPPRRGDQDLGGSRQGPSR